MDKMRLVTSASDGQVVAVTGDGTADAHSTTPTSVWHGIGTDIAKKQATSFC
jgi:high-affinity K+ transport system ATPase subunit B